MVYKHNPTHHDVENRINGNRFVVRYCCCLSTIPTFYSNSADSEANGESMTQVAKTPLKPPKRGSELRNTTMLQLITTVMTQVPACPLHQRLPSLQQRRSAGRTAQSVQNHQRNKSKTAKATAVSLLIKSKKKAAARAPSPPPPLAKNKACIRCREKKIECNEAKPIYSQCGGDGEHDSTKLLDPSNNRRMAVSVASNAGASALRRSRLVRTV